MRPGHGLGASTWHDALHDEEGDGECCCMIPRRLQGFKSFPPPGCIFLRERPLQYVVKRPCDFQLSANMQDLQDAYAP